MGIYEDIQNDLGQAFDTDLSDAVKECFYVTITEVKDPVTNGNVKTRDETKSRAVFSSFKSQEISASQGSILNDDTKCLFLDSELSVDVRINDEIKVSGKTFLIINFKQDPANATYTIQTRGAGNGRI